MWLKLLLLITCSSVAHANMTLAQQVLEQPQIVGQARLKVLLFKDYDATLYALQGS